MSKFGYPKYGKSQRLGRAGESFIDSFIHQKLGWIYRSVHQESDFGIDGYIISTKRLKEEFDMREKANI
jgi:hypothetical protein